MPELFIGLMSVTSMDGIDAALVDCASSHPALQATHAGSYPPEIHARLVPATGLQNPREHDLSDRNNAAGAAFADTAMALLQQAGLTPADIRAIGSHGQTIRHEPDAPQPYSLQIGNPHTISTRTGIDVVADFRNPDIAAGGQGAPLVPAFTQPRSASGRSSRISAPA